MISFQEAIDIIQRNSTSLSSQKLATIDALQCVLSHDVIAPINMPPFNQSAMDGYAVGANDGQQFEVIDEIQAGKDANHVSLLAHQAARIFTGAMVPAGSVAVVKQEIVKRNGNQITISETIGLNDNFRLCGEQIQKGNVALPKGTVLTPGTIGFLMTLGITEVEVHREPVVTIVVTGNELVKPGETLAPGKIYESNSFMLQAAFKEMGIQVQIVHATDDLDEIIAVFDKALKSCDVLITTGGISVGDYDFVGKALQTLQVQELFYKVKQKPGKPLYFGKKKNTLIFSLPGNPAAALSCFYLYVRSAIHWLKGNQNAHMEQRSLKLTSEYTKTPNLAHFLKGNAVGDSVSILHAQSSAMLSSYGATNAIIHLEEGKTNWQAGDVVNTYILP